MKIALALSSAILATVLSTGAMAQGANQTTEMCSNPSMKQDPRCVGTAPAAQAPMSTTTNAPMRAATPTAGSASPSAAVDNDGAACSMPANKQDPRCVGANPAPNAR